MEDGKKFVRGVTSVGDCLVGCDGKLFSVHDLKLELINCKPDRLTLTLDCCRSRSRKVGEEKKEYVILRYLSLSVE